MPKDFIPLKDHLVESVDKTPEDLQKYLNALCLMDNWEIVSVQFVKMLAFSRARWFIVARRDL